MGVANKTRSSQVLACFRWRINPGAPINAGQMRSQRKACIMLNIMATYGGVEPLVVQSHGVELHGKDIG